LEFSPGHESGNRLAALGDDDRFAGLRDFIHYFHTRLSDSVVIGWFPSLVRLPATGGLDGDSAKGMVLAADCTPSLIHSLTD